MKNNGSNGSSSSSTSPSLLHQVAARDSAAWKRFVDLYGPLVFHWCRRGELSDDDAADVMQEVFTSVSRRVDRFLDADDRDGTFRGWLLTITQNRIRDHYRKRARQVSARGGSDAQLQMAEVPDIWSDLADDESEQTAVASLFRRAVELVRGDFAPNTWQAFWRATIEGHDTADIAADLGMSANGVRQAKSRVLRRLRQELGERSRSDL